MSSNPFRRPLVKADADQGPGAELDNGNEDRLPPEAARGTKKVVRISSPPRPRPEGASSTNAQTLPAAFQDLLPYVTNAYLSVNRSWPAVSAGRDEAESSDDDEGPEEAGKMAAAPIAASRGLLRLPHSPSNSGTMPADKEGATAAGGPSKPDAPSSDNAGHAVAFDATDAQRSGSVKAASATAMDVNAFTNLLMTGNPSTTDLAKRSNSDLDRRSAPMQPSARTAGMLQGDNSSSTDTSSIDRHSTEPASQYTPRSSSERSRSDQDDEEVAGDTGTTTKLADSQKVKPPPPRHRYGKSINLPDGPQIVSFADFRTPEASSPISPVASPAEHSRRISDDYRKPLPPTPQSRSSRNASASSELLRTFSIGSVRSEQNPSQKKQAPPPPLARRASVRNVLSPPSRTPSGTTIRSDQDSIPEAGGSTSSQKIAPPPPAPRRGGNNHAQSPSIDDSVSPQVTRSPSVKFAPPVPEARRARASSRASASSITAVSDSKSSSSNSTPMASPPPPPPRRMSSRSSFDATPRRPQGSSQRSSFEAVDETGSGSGRQGVGTYHQQHTADVTGTTKPTGSKDILADMDKLQREIDALMARDGKGAV